MTAATDHDEAIERLRRIVLGRLESLQRAGVATLPKPSTGAAITLLPPRLDSPLVPEVPPSRFELKPTRLASSPVATTAPPPKVTGVPLPNPSAENDSMPKRAAAAASSLNSAPPPTKVGSGADTLAQRIASLEAMRCDVAECTRCPALASTRTQTVFGTGNPQARIVFFGEAPGADEDRTGEPFVGRAGQLLTKIIEACGFARGDVYIMNSLRCRPPDNRNPSDEEVENCRPWFEGQFDIIQPEYVVCVGSIPTKALLRNTKSIGQMRGRFHEWNKRKVLCTYHPAYLLRNPDAKKLVWDDMKFLLADMGLEVPKAR